MSKISEIDFSVYANSHNHDFIGREWVFEELNNWLASDKTSRFFVITGKPGSGKTAIAKRLYQFSKGNICSSSNTPYITKGFLDAFHFCSAKDRRWINPDSFIESIAVQLANGYTDYAEVLAEITATPRLHMDLHQNIQEMYGGHTAGFIINNLNLRGISIEDAFIKIIREPLEALFNKGSGREIVILIDGLDESLLYTGDSNIVSLISHAEFLPASIRFIVTCCPDIKILRSLKQSNSEIREISITTGTGEIFSREDIKKYIIHELNKSPQLTEKISINFTVSSFVSTLEVNSECNFLYISYLLDMLILQGKEITEETIDELPKGLDGIYMEYLVRIIGEDDNKWNEWYKSIFGILAVIQEPLKEVQLSKFTGISETQIRRLTKEVSRLLDINKSSANGEWAYSIYHRSFSNFLLDRKKAEEYWCNEVEQHNRIIEYYKEKCNGNWTSLVEENYARRYLTLHLASSQNWDTLYNLIATFGLNRHKSSQPWALARLKYEKSFTGYLSDIELLWRKAEEENNISNQILCALISTSIKMRSSNLPPYLIIQLVIEGTSEEKWNIESVLEHIQQMISPWEKIRVIEALVESNCELPYSKLLDFIYSIQDESARVDGYTSLIPHLPAYLINDILLYINDFKTPVNKANILIKLAQYVPAEQQLDIWIKVIETIPQIEHSDSSCTVSSGGTCEGLFPISNYVDVLASIAPLIPWELLPRAIEAVHTVKWGYYKSGLLASFAHRFPVLEQISIWEDILATVNSIIEEDFRARAFAIIAASIIDELVIKAFEYCCHLEDPECKAFAMAAFAKRLPQDLLPNVVAAACSLPETIRLNYPRMKPHVVFLPELVHKVLPETADTSFDLFNYESLHARALAAVEVFVSEEKYIEIWREALIAADMLPDSMARSKYFRVLVPHIPTELAEFAFCKIKSIEDEEELACALVALAPKLSSEMVIDVLDIIKNISYEDYSIGVIKSLKPLLTGKQLLEVLSIVRKLNSTYHKASILSEFASLLPIDEKQKVIAEALCITEEIADKEQQCEFLDAMIPYISTVSSDKKLAIYNIILNLAKDIHDEEDYINAIMPVIPYLPKHIKIKIVNEVLEIVHKIKNGGKRAKLLADLMPLIPYRRIVRNKQKYRLLTKMLADANKANIDLWDCLSRDICLHKIIPYLPKKLMPVALQIIKSIKNEIERAYLLVYTVPYIQDRLIQEAYEIANTISGENSAYGKFDNAFVESMLLKFFSKQKLAECYAIFKLRLKKEQSLPENLLNIFDFTQDRIHAEYLFLIAPHITAKGLDGMIKSADTIENPGYRAYALSAYIQHLSPEKVTTLLPLIFTIEEEAIRMQTLNKVIMNLSPEQIENTIIMLKDIKEDFQLAADIVVLAPYLSFGQLSDLLILTYKMDSIFFRIKALAAIVVCFQKANPQTNEIWKDILKFLSNISSDKIPEILEIVLPDMPEDLITNVIYIIFGIDNDSDRNNSLYIFVKHLIALPNDEKQKSWLQLTIRKLSTYKRATFLQGLSSLAPWLVKSLNEQELSNIFDILIDVTCCWP